MANRKVSLVWLCRTDEGWKRFPAVVGKNGKLRPGYADVKGEHVHYPDGRYQLRSYKGSRTIYTNVENPAEALNDLKRKTHLLVAKHSAASAGPGVEVVGEITSRLSLQRKKDEFIKRLVSQGHQRASETALIAIDDFLEATDLTYADEVTEDSILKFYRYLRRRGNVDRTIYNKHVSLFGFFKWLKMDVKKLAEKPPTYTERDVEEYDLEDLRVLFAACDEYQKVVFETLLKTGIRMQEGMHLEWTNVDFRRKVIRVRELLDTESDIHARIKDRAERSVPLPDDLAETLKAWKAKHPKTRLVLGTVNDTPNWKWLQMLKRVARRAKLNCGHCAGCRNTDECNRWKLKTFRSTYITIMLRSGFDPRTVMDWTGHEDLATLEKYWAAAKTEEMQERVNAVKWV
jgi:integrase